MQINLNAAVTSYGVIYDFQGQKVRELDLGGKRQILWNAPDVPGLYYIVLVGADGSRTEPKVFQVY